MGASHICKKKGSVGSVGRGRGEMGRWGDGEMGRWGDGEMGEVFIKGNYPDMI
ncbi:hypothetical protein BJP36_43455 [Moorena producens JHB]|uniref:Uncharacterized protein n=1 Tax=Moorena producens (strain JHB) TaxID=1454205 RepID=A0A9Q9ST82_MOOP1|nr:hypothetical protein [Moorena producens]WAN69218.1 hypothetical protein BJP36_43455 [Moorena producens JHB]